MRDIEYQFNYVNREGKASWLKTSGQGSIGVLWYRNDLARMDLFVPFGVPKGTNMYTCRVSYTIPRIFTWSDTPWTLKGVQSCDLGDLEQRVSSSKTYPEDNSLWVSETPLTDTKGMYSDDDDYRADVEIISQGCYLG